MARLCQPGRFRWRVLGQARPHAHRTRGDGAAHLVHQGPRGALSVAALPGDMQSGWVQSPGPTSGRPDDNLRDTHHLLTTCVARADWSPSGPGKARPDDRLRHKPPLHHRRMTARDSNIRAGVASPVVAVDGGWRLRVQPALRALALYLSAALTRFASRAPSNAACCRATFLALVSYCRSST